MALLFLAAYVLCRVGVWKDPTDGRSRDAFLTVAVKPP